MSGNKPEQKAFDEARNKYVAMWEKKQASIKQKKVRQLTIAQTATGAFLRNSTFDGIIRNIIYSLNTKFVATKIVNGVNPLEGELLDGHIPAFIIDNMGMTKSGTKFSVPGLKYSFYFDLNSVSIMVNICRHPSGPIYPVFTLTHTNGRYHQVDWKAFLEDPNDDQLKEWLSGQIQKIVSRKESEESETIFLAN